MKKYVKRYLLLIFELILNTNETIKLENVMDLRRYVLIRSLRFSDSKNIVAHTISAYKLEKYMNEELLGKTPLKIDTSSTV